MSRQEIVNLQCGLIRSQSRYNPSVLSRLYLVLAISAGLSNAQECRLTPLTSEQPALRIEEGESALASQTFQTTAFALSPSNVVHFFDSANRIRRIDTSGRLVTVAGNGTRAEAATTAGSALETPLAAVSQIVFSPDGVLYFSSQNRVFRVMSGRIEPFAGSARLGFNGEAGPALEMNLGNIVNMAFDRTGALHLIDGYQRVRKVEADGMLRTIAGSTRVAATTGFTGDNGPATDAALSSPGQVVPFADGSLWIKDLLGRHLRLVRPDGIIETINANFPPNANILIGRGEVPIAGLGNTLYGISTEGALDVAPPPYASFNNGIPLGIGTDGAIYSLGTTRPEQRLGLLRFFEGEQTVLAAALLNPVGGRVGPYGVWRAPNSLIYAGYLDGKFGILEARVGQNTRFLVGGGTESGDVDGKSATSISMEFAREFTVDGNGRIVIGDLRRNRILIADGDGKIAVLKTETGQPVLFMPLGSFSNQIIVADNDGNIYWTSYIGPTPAGERTAIVAVWSRATAAISGFTVTGGAGLTRLEDGTAAAIAGNEAFRSVYRITPAGLGDVLPELRMLPLQSVTHFRAQPYFVANSRLFRGEPGAIEMLDIRVTPSGWPFIPDFVLSSANAPIVHDRDGGFYRIENVDSCKWSPQPVISAKGVVNAASFGYVDTFSPGELITVFGSGFGPAEGQGMVLDGTLRAIPQPAPYPMLQLGRLFGNSFNTSLIGFDLPVINSSNTQTTVQTTSVNLPGEYFLYFRWQGLLLTYPTPIIIQAATPGIFASGGTAVAFNEDGSLHSPTNPAPPGSVLQIYGTGLGLLDTQPPLGAFNSTSVLTRTTSTATGTIGDEPAEVLFAGGAPGQIGGVYQMNVRVPKGLASGAQPLQIRVAEYPAKPVIIYVR